MKYLIIFLFLPLISEANFSKPNLLARLSDQNAWNAPDNMWCFSSEPGVLKGNVYLGCFDNDGHLMGQWGKEGFEIISRALPGKYFSVPVNSFNKISWHEFDEWSISRSLEFTNAVSVTEVTNLGPLAIATDNLLPYSPSSFIYRIKGDSPEIWIWKNNEAVPFFNPGAAYIFTPQVGPAGEIALKTRDVNLSESAPDKVWLFNNSWQVILEDQDANPASPWIKIRHHMCVEDQKVLTIAQDKSGEALILIENNKTKVLARTGRDLKSFDYFAPKMRAGTIVVRGVDLEGRKSVFVHDENGFRNLLTQGDTVHTDLGVGRVHYHNQDAIFYGAPGIDESGSVVLQATLSDDNHPETLLGIGIIKFIKE